MPDDRTHERDRECSPPHIAIPDTFAGAAAFYSAGRRYQRLRFHYGQAILLLVPPRKPNFRHVGEPEKRVDNAFRAVIERQERAQHAEAQSASEQFAHLLRSIVDFPIDGSAFVEVQGNLQEAWKRGNESQDEDFVSELTDFDSIVAPRFGGVSLDTYAEAIVEQYVTPRLDRLKSAILNVADRQGRHLFLLGATVEKAFCPDTFFRFLRSDDRPGTWHHKKWEELEEATEPEPTRELTEEELVQLVMAGCIAARRCNVAEARPTRGWRN